MAETQATRAATTPRAVHAEAAPLRPGVRRGALLGRAHGRARAAPLGARGDPAGARPLRRLDRHPLLLPRRRSAAPAACASTASRRSPATRTSTRALPRRARDGVIEIEPMGNMPVIKDLIVDMDAVHWKKVQRVTPWLIAKQPVPEREYIVPRESMVDVTQTMACIQCGACVSDCLAMEVDPGFIGPAALAKAYRFVGDPRDDQQFERLNDLAAGPAGDLRLHALLQVRAGVPEGRQPDGPDHAPAADRDDRPAHRRPEQRRAPRGGVHDAGHATTACCARPSCCRAPTAATRGSASSTRPPARSCSRSLPVDR